MTVRFQKVLFVVGLVFSSTLFFSAQIASATKKATDKSVYNEGMMLSPNRKWAVSSLPSLWGAKSALFVWDSRTKKLVKRASFSWSYVAPLAFSRSGRFLAISGTTVGDPEHEQHNYLQIWDAQSWRLLRVLEDSTRDSTSIAEVGRFSDDEKVLITVNHYRIEKWSLRTGKRFKTIPLGFEASMEGGMEAQISNNGSLLLVASGGSLALMQMNDGKVLRRFDRHAENDFLAFSPDERVVLEIDSEGWLRVWDTKTGKTLWSLNGDFGFPSFSRDSRYVKLPVKKGVVLRNARTGISVPQLSTR